MIGTGERRAFHAETQRRTTVPGALLGNWSVSRTVLDYRAGTVFRFEGSAVLTGTSFEERGHMQCNGGRVAAERSYGIRAGKGSVAILFANGSPFIELEPCATQAVHHQCGGDSYSGRFFFRGDGDWAEHWRVIGPRKRYASLARYRRPTAIMASLSR